ncbi:DUF421 domain-containing protein [Streptomyces chitinivorans]|uniref:DUF421 domain-containing protein n=1 Tax=Streptomyces chitinivorans TaxID=1257027 RepID=A0ABW7I013_9ACTN|nr:YetF domain-containing protein [Streptomyces chitinivorans]MDH2408004.1 DUF421 domain-containing protein [Streptomyces chitinivorans]
MPDWNTLFAPSVPLLELFLRGTVTFLLLMAMVRVAGQREAGGLGITDVFLVVLVGQAVAPGLVGKSSSIADGVLLAATVVCWSLALDAAAYRWPRLARVIKSRPRPLIEDGRLSRKVMRREMMTEGEIMTQLRLHGIEDVSQVRRAYLEPNGMISILRRGGGEPDEPPRPAGL